VRIDSLQAGRAVAALAVVAHHANLASRDFGSSYFAPLNYGWLGVDFFFVLSGFIITWSAPGKTAPEFAWHRFRRVVLPYWPIGVGMALLYTLSGKSPEQPWSWLTTFTLLPITPGPALSVAWTLQHEMLFYSLFLAFWFSGRFVFGLCLWALLIGVAWWLGLQWLALKPINLEFMFGVAACYAVRHSITWPAILSPLPLIAWIALGADRQFSPLVGLSIALLLPAVVIAEIRQRFVVGPVLIFLGAGSYSLYLAHGLAISIAARIWPSLPFLFVFGAVGGLAYFCCIEKPLLRLSRARSTEPSEGTPVGRL